MSPVSATARLLVSSRPLVRWHPACAAVDCLGVQAEHARTARPRCARRAQVRPERRGWMAASGRISELRPASSVLRAVHRDLGHRLPGRECGSSTSILRVVTGRRNSGVVQHVEQLWACAGDQSAMIEVDVLHLCRPRAWWSAEGRSCASSGRAQPWSKTWNTESWLAAPVDQ